MNANATAEHSLWTAWKAAGQAALRKLGYRTRAERLAAWKAHLKQLAEDKVRHERNVLHEKEIERERMRDMWDLDVERITKEINEAYERGDRFINLQRPAYGTGVILWVANGDQRVIDMQLHTPYVPSRGGWAEPTTALLTLHKRPS